MNSQWEQSEPNGQGVYPAATASEAPHDAEHPPVSALTAEPPPVAAPVAEPVAVQSGKAQGDAGNDNIDKIRDILFGGHMRDYDSRFARLEQTLMKESAEIRESARKTVERLEGYVKQELEALHVRFKTERDERAASLSAISRELQEAGEGLSKRIAEVDDHATGVHHELREQILQHGRDLTDQIHTKEREMATLLEQRFQELRKDKTDKAALSALFSEVAMRLNNEFHLPGSDH